SALRGRRIGSEPGNVNAGSHHLGERRGVSPTWEPLARRAYASTLAAVTFPARQFPANPASWPAHSTWPDRRHARISILAHIAVITSPARHRPHANLGSVGRRCL